MSDYLAHEGLEHAERAHQHVQGDAPRLLKVVPLAAAVLAVLAGLSSLLGNRLAEAMLRAGNEAILAETKAADTWNEYEAQSLKRHIAADLGLAATDALAKRRLSGLERSYAAREKPLRVDAEKLEAERNAAIERMDNLEARKLNMDRATALFQIAIVLASIGALTRQPLLSVFGFAGGLVGLIFCVLGLLR